MAGTFEKVSECLYRYTANGTYYARFEVGGKEVRRSLRTTDKPLAKRRLADLQRDLARVDLSAGKFSLTEMCDRYLATVQSQKPKTVKRKREIAARLKKDFPGGSNVPVSKIPPSKIGAWLASYDFGPASYNLYLEFIRAVFTLAVDDKVLASSPIDSLKGKRRAKPIRQTPTPEEFAAIVADIRAQAVFNPSVKQTADFVEFIGLAGLGQAEASSLMWGDINWQKERITTFRHKTSQGFQIPIFPQLRPLLERMREECGGSPPVGEKVFDMISAKNAIYQACKRLTDRCIKKLSLQVELCVGKGGLDKAGFTPQAKDGSRQIFA